MKKKTLSLATKITLIVLSTTLLSTAIISVFSYILNRNSTIELKAEKALAIANSIVANVDAEQFSQILQTQEENDYYAAFKKFLDKTFNENNILYMYVLDKNYDEEEVHYFAEGYPYDSRDEEPEILLGETDKTEYYADEMFEALSTGKASVTDIYDSGEDYGFMVSGFAPIFDKNDAVIGVVGVDLSIQDIMNSSNQFGLIIIAIVVALCVIIGVFFAWYIKRSFGRPILELTESAEKIAQGDIDVEIATVRNDEIGKLIESFRNMARTSRRQADALNSLASGDLTPDIVPNSKKDSINIALMETIDNFNNMFHEIHDSTFEVSVGAKQIADGAQTLAEGSAQQSETMENLASFVSDVAEKTKDNARRAEKAAALSTAIKANAETGSQQMDKMMAAVRDINEASKSINKVIKVIDDIAFQTNILALNAAVEAARAGQHGKGFAVVAEEVRNLAGKSAEAAKNTDALIADSIQKAELGAQIASETSESLQQIVSGINESSVIVEEISRSSDDQKLAIDEINGSIEKVAQVVMQNSATAQESASSSQHMSAQSDRLQDLVARFKLKEDSVKRLPNKGGW